MLVVSVPNTYEAERAYVVAVILGDWLGLDHVIEVSVVDRVRIFEAGARDGPMISIEDGLFATPPGDWLDERSLPAVPSPRFTLPTIGEGRRFVELPTDHLFATLPAIYSRRTEGSAVWQRTPGGVEMAIDPFGDVFFLLSRYEEVVRPVQDAHGRFPGAASVIGSQGLLDRPLADEYVDVLWAAINELWPNLRRRSSRYRLRPTHDVDDPWATHGRAPGVILHGLAADIARRRDVGLAARRVRSIWDSLSGRVDRDPFDTFDLLMSVSERNGLRSTFYFMAGNEPSDPDFRYRISDPLIIDLLRGIHERGHEVGLHASYASYLSPDRTLQEFESLRAACLSAGFDQGSWGVRQHYLRFQNPTTWRNHESAGFDHDSTLGFADRLGFRAGTCREFPIFDVLAARALRLRQRPLIVMDATMTGYLALDADAVDASARAIVAAAVRHDGDAVILYHNSSLPRRAQQARYGALVDGLAHLGAG